MANAPALIDAQAGRVLDALNGFISWINNHVIGGNVADGGTTQASGASGALNYDIDTTAIVDSAVSGVAHPQGLAAATDADSDAGSGLDWGATSGVSVVFAVLFSTGVANDTPAIEARYGTVAATGQEIPPTDAEITASLGHSNWVRICNHTINRTADTTVTHSFDDDVRNPVRGYSDLATDVRFAS